MLTQDELQGLGPKAQFQQYVRETTLETLEIFMDDWAYYMSLREFVIAGDYHGMVRTLRELRAELPEFSRQTIALKAHGGPEELRKLGEDAILAGELDNILGEWNIILGSWSRVPSLTWPVMHIKRPRHPEERRKSKKKSKKHKKK